jgi:hypothetical protein
VAAVEAADAGGIQSPASLVANLAITHLPPRATTETTVLGMRPPPPPNHSPQKWSTLVCSWMRDSSSTGGRRAEVPCRLQELPWQTLEDAAFPDRWLILKAGLLERWRWFTVLRKDKKHVCRLF